jgi:excisionase family DNA binding protein
VNGGPDASATNSDVNNDLTSEAEPPITMRDFGSDYLMTTSDLAAYLGVAVKTIYNWRCRRIGPPAYKPGGSRLRFKRRDVERWLEDESGPEQ